MIKLSKTTKMGCMSWSLPAVDTCPGSRVKGSDQMVDACQACYARFGTYLYPKVKSVREDNMEDWKRPEWADEMVAELDSHRYFRWFDSGDVYHIDLAYKLLDIMQRTPWVKHWLPTRMHKFDKFAAVLAAMNALPNVRVRYSSDSVISGYDATIHGSTILHNDNVPDGVTLCTAYQREGKCGPCRACWDKDVAVIGYKAHGMKVKTVIKIALASAAA